MRQQRSKQPEGKPSFLFEGKMRELLEQRGIEYKEESKYYVACPKCTADRSKQGTRSLSVDNQVDHISIKCLHSADCEYHKPVVLKLDSTSPKQEAAVEKVTYVHIPADMVIPVPAGAKKYKYCDKEGNILFYVIRTQDKKFFPMSLTSEGDLVAKKPNFTTLYGAELLSSDDRPVIVVEGEKAAEAARDIFKSSDVVSWVGGATNVAQGDWSLIAGRNIVLWPDNDQAGITAMRNLVKILDSSRISFIDTTSLPPKYDLADPIDLNKIKELYRDREHISMNLFPDQVSYKELLGMITKKQEAKFFGFRNMDKHLALPNAGVVTVEGRSGHGKSVFMLNLALRLLRNTNYNVVFISYEVPKQEAFLRFLMAAEGRELSPVTYQNIEAYRELILSSGSPVIAEEISKYYNKRFWISDYSSSLKELLGWLDTTKMENTVIFIDYLQIIPNKGYSNTSSARYQVIKDTIEALREMALRRSQVIVVGSQVTDGEIPAQDQARESKDVLFTSALTLQVWNKDMARVSETVKTKKGGKGEDDIKEDYFNNVAGNYAVSVKKSRVGGLGQVFGFNLLYGCLLQEAEVGYTEF